MEPEDGTTSGPWVVFQIGYEGQADLRPRKLRFRVTLEPLGKDVEGYVFDQRKTRAGWFAGEPGQVLYRSRKPLRDATYRWRAWYWNGTDWVGATPPRELRIDAVPPDEVGPLRVSHDAETGQVLLQWDPVVLDANGAPEFVARYRVYRYEKRTFPGGLKTLLIGEVVEPRFIDLSPPASESRVLYYKVTAVDQAQNESEGRR